MTWEWPQITVLVLCVLQTGVNLAKHGEPKNDKYNFPIALVANAILLGLLYFGGFWG